MDMLTHLGEFLTLCLVAVALGMDAFSMSIGLGMRGLRLLHIAQISFLVGIFHMIMPLFGMIIGRYLSDYIGDLAITIGGILLIGFGIHMIYSSLFEEDNKAWINITGIGILFFALGVSIDGFSVGLSLGLFAANTLITIMLFGFFGFLLACIGLLIGRKVGHWVGAYGEILGGIILLIFGFKFLL